MIKTNSILIREHFSIMFHFLKHFVICSEKDKKLLQNNNKISATLKNENEKTKQVFKLGDNREVVGSNFEGCKRIKRNRVGAALLDYG